MIAGSKVQKVGDEHPLTNFLVLKEVLKYDTSPGPILRNRLVHPSWLDICAEDWLKLEKYPVLRYNAVPEGDGEQKLARRSRLQMSLPEFYELYQAGHLVVTQMVATRPRKVDLHAWEFPGEEMALQENKRNEFSLQLDRWFWTWSATPWLAELTLVNSEFEREAWVFKERFLRTLPNLKKLTVRDCVVHAEALRDINQDLQNWMEHEDRENWKMARRSRRPNHFPGLSRAQPRGNRGNLFYFEGGYQHGLTCLDVSLTVAVGEKENGVFELKPTTPLRIWGPLLAMLPKLERLRIGGYHEDTEEPPPTLKPPGWDNDADPLLQKLDRIQNPVEYSILQCLLKGKSHWFGEFGEEPAPVHLGNFWELIWDEVIGQVEATLESLDLLDFSGRAQEYGVLSTYEAAVEYKTRSGMGYVYFFPRMTEVALDLGLNPRFAELDMKILWRWVDNPRRLKFYRAPFNITFPTFHKVPKEKQIDELELWGNVSLNMNFLNASFIRMKKMCWTTSCFDEKYRGQRVYHLMLEGRRAYPLFRKDLVENTDWSEIMKCGGLKYLSHLEMDWGPMSLKSWRQLHKVMRNLRNLKGFIYGNEQLAEISRLWPRLESLEMAHGSRVTAEGLAQYLPLFANLRKFTWAKCACTSELFKVEKNFDLLRQVGIQLKNQLPRDAVVALPWSLFDGIPCPVKRICIQSEFEQALLTGETSKFFKALE